MGGCFAGSTDATDDPAGRSRIPSCSIPNTSGSASPRRPASGACIIPTSDCAAGSRTTRRSPFMSIPLSFRPWREKSSLRSSLSHSKRHSEKTFRPRELSVASHLLAAAFESQPVSHSLKISGQSFIEPNISGFMRSNGVQRAAPLESKLILDFVPDGEIWKD